MVDAIYLSTRSWTFALELQPTSWRLLRIAKSAIFRYVRPKPMGFKHSSLVVIRLSKVARSLFTLLSISVSFHYARTHDHLIPSMSCIIFPPQNSKHYHIYVLEYMRILWCKKITWKNKKRWTHVFTNTYMIYETFFPHAIVTTKSWMESIKQMHMHCIDRTLCKE